MRRWAVLPLCGLALFYALNYNQTESPAETWERSRDQTRSLSDGMEDQGQNKKILVELFLSRERKEDLDAIKRELEAVSITRVRTQFFRLGNPPENIAIGKNIPAPVARLAIQLAITYNKGVKFLLPQFRFFPDHIAIGTSAFDEASQIPILPEDLERLLDPHLSTPEFHTLYRALTGEEKRLPTYIN